MKSFWQKLPHPFFILAPMEDVTDTVFRRVIIECGKPDVFITEFTNVDGIYSSGCERVLRRFQFTQDERPIVAQIWGNNPDKYYKVAQLIVKMGFDGIDINMGCPEGRIIKRGYCSGLIKNHTLAVELIEATRKGAGDLPVSVKTRIGYSSIMIEEWIGFLLQQHLDALTIHLRTVSELSEGSAHWDEMMKIIQLRNRINKDTVIIGNGDIISYNDGLQKYENYHCEGLMVGRGIFHNPWLFDKDKDIASVSVKERLRLLARHIQLFDETWGGSKHFDILKKFYKIYLSGFPGANAMRLFLMQYKTAKDTLVVLSQLEKNI